VWEKIDSMKVKGNTERVKKKGIGATGREGGFWLLLSAYDASIVMLGTHSKSISTVIRIHLQGLGGD
jgi:hypothetical protein